MILRKFPQNTPLSEQVYQLIEEQIINGNYLVGDKLPTEKQLTEFYKVSRTVIREAIKALKEKGWVETRVAKGSFVISNFSKSMQSSFDAAVRMEPEDGFDNLLQLRSIFEPEVAALGAANACEENLKTLRNAIELMEKALEDNNNVEEFIRGDSAFHVALAESTKNRLIIMIITSIIDIMHDFQIYHFSRVKNGGQRSNNCHKRIFDAIEKHDSDSARTTMSEHICQLSDDIQNCR